MGLCLPYLLRELPIILQDDGRTIHPDYVQGERELVREVTKAGECLGAKECGENETAPRDDGKMEGSRTK